jgi:hypothetical protein
MLNIISLGAGVQSSTMALMAAHGEITPMPDCAIFADTGAEPEGVYRWLEWLETKLPFPVHHVMKDQGLRVALIESLNNKRFASIPFFTESIKGGGMMRRQCTNEFKIVPIKKKIRDLLGLEKGQRAGKEVKVIQWIGISTDEATRMKPSRDKWMVNRFPLLDLDMSRNSCLNWMMVNGYPQPTKSACTFCPYHDDALWRDMKMNDPVSFSDAVHIDSIIRSGVRNTKEKLYLHKSMKPLSDVDFRNAEDVGQIRLFDNECEGMCGL